MHCNQMSEAPYLVVLKCIFTTTPLWIAKILTVSSLCLLIYNGSYSEKYIKLWNAYNYLLITPLF